MCTSRVAIAPGQVNLFARSPAAHASFQSTFLGRGRSVRVPERTSSSPSERQGTPQRHGVSGDGVASVYLPALLIGLWQL